LALGKLQIAKFCIERDQGDQRVPGLLGGVLGEPGFQLAAQLLALLATVLCLLCNQFILSSLHEVLPFKCESYLVTEQLKDFCHCLRLQQGLLVVHLEGLFGQLEQIEIAAEVLLHQPLEHPVLVLLLLRLNLKLLHLQIVYNLCSLCPHFDFCNGHCCGWLKNLNGLYVDRFQGPLGVEDLFAVKKHGLDDSEDIGEAFLFDELLVDAKQLRVLVSFILGQLLPR
jgi:hypothetical protein